MRSHVRGARLIALALVVSVLRLSVAAPASADFIVPTIVAQHAFVGDPLWGLDTAEGSIYGIAPDERTAMASTTKIMTLHLLNNAIAVGFVDPNDLVTVSALAASIGGSTMADVNTGVPLQAGEVVTLDGLARGMMYPSGNNAAWAIAEYVATSIYGPFGSSQDAVNVFLDLMNDHAASMGLVDTHFTSPNGFDDPFQAGVTPAPEDFNHYTTARELAKIMAHAITDEYFQSVVGFQGTYTTTGTPPSGPLKTYQWGSGSNYPGWEGAKGGGTQNCNGPNQACVVTSASRLGRRVVIAEMQADPTNEQAPLLDLGFASIFHPALLAEKAGGKVLAQAVECLPSGRAVTAVITTTNALQLTTWSLPLAGGSIDKIASSPVRALIGDSGGSGGKGGVKGVSSADVDVLRLASGHVITASKAGGSIRLGAWNIAGDGTPTALVAGVDAGSGRSVSLAPVAPNVFVTAVRANNNQLTIKSWRLAASLRGGGWSISLLDTELGGGFLANVSEVGAGGSGMPSLFTGKSPVVVPVRQANGDASIGFYDVDPSTGKIDMNVFIGGGTTGSHFSVATMLTDDPDSDLFAPQFFAISLKDDAEHLLVKHYRVDPDGEAVSLGSVQGSFPVLETAVTTFDHGGVVVTARDLADHDVVGVFEGRRTASDGISGDEVVKHIHGQGRAVDSCRAPTTLAEAEVLTTAIVSGDLTLRLFQLGARPPR
jgi:D-alanyl-D-alanine carboxypeptidase